MRTRAALGRTSLSMIGLLLVVMLAGKQVDPTAHLRVHPLNLTHPDKVLTTTAGIGPSHFGYFSWRNTSRLGFRFGDIRAFDLVKLKVRSSCESCVLRVKLDSTIVRSIVISSTWHEWAIPMPHDGDVVELIRPTDAPCTIHFSRVKSTNVVGYHNTFPQLYVRYDPRPYVVPGLQPSHVTGIVLQIATIAFCLLFLVGFLTSATDWDLVFIGFAGWFASVALLAAFEILDVLGPLRVVYPAQALWALLLVPEMLGLLFGLRRPLARAAARTLLFLREVVRRSWWPAIVRAPYWRLRLSRDQTAVAALTGAMAYAALLVAFLPRTPFEWDEVLFLRALIRFDVARHSPHPPGYPVFFAAEKLIQLIGAAPVRAPQIASIIGAVFAVVFVVFLLRRLGASTFSAALAAILLAAVPAFAFNANVGLSDTLATTLTLAAALGLVRFLEEPTSHRKSAVAGLLTALAMGARPQVALALFILVGWAILRSLLVRQWPAITFMAVAVTASAVCWLPPIMATGWHRYWGSVRDMRRWMGVHETRAHLPNLPISRVADAWLIRPLGAEWTALLFLAMVAIGAWCWWHAGRRRLVVALAACGVGYVLTAPWFMAANTSVRYVLPGLPFLAGLAAGTTALRKPVLEVLGTVGLVAIIVGMTSWGVPVYAQRAAEDAPVWGALEWVRHHEDPQSMPVDYDGVFRPHAQYVLGRRGFVIHRHRNPQGQLPLGQCVRVLSPARSIRGRVVYIARWRDKRMRQLTRNRYLSCAVVLPFGRGTSMAEERNKITLPRR